MFSPAARKPHLASTKNRSLGHGVPDSPATPLPEGHRSVLGAAIPNRPITGTPAPWSSRLSVLARIPAEKKTEKGGDANQTQPVYVGEFPQVVRNAQANLLQKSSSACDNTVLAGGMDKGTSLSWIICGRQIFIWSYLSAAVSKKCVALEIPSAFGDKDDMKSMPGNHWMVCVVGWGIASSSSEIMLGQCSSAGIVLCNQKTQAIVYWPDVFSDSENIPIASFPTPEAIESDLTSDGRKATKWNHGSNWVGSDNLSEHVRVNSIIVTAIPGNYRECVAIACQSNGDLWLFHFTLAGIYWRRISHDAVGISSGHSHMNKGHARSLIWHSQHACPEESGRQFFLLTDCEIQCWNITLTPDINVTRLWTHEIVADDGDLGIRKDLAGQKHIWLLDMQVDGRAKEFTILVATLCKDRVSSSSYMQYSLLTMQYKFGQNFSLESSGSTNERVLEKKAPLQVIIPKARVEDEEFLFSMRLRVGGKPSGSAIILSGDGTATVTNYWRRSTRLYQFDLPWDAGKVLDASVFPSSEDNEEGAWVVLTEKAGVWAIPEKAVLLGGVEPPERSLSRKGSSNEGVVEEERRSQAFGGNVDPRRPSSEAWIAGDRQRVAFMGIAKRTAQDEEAEALLGHLFHEFILSGEVEGALGKLRKKGAFEKEGEINVFARMSKSIVDTLAKHWTTTRGAEFVASAVVSSLLLDKQQKHKKYLQFIAFSKCHDELSSRQRHSLLAIMEHGEKLSGMMQLRELQNSHSQNRSNVVDSLSSHSQIQTAGSSLWNLIQLVGEKARRNTVLLMDRDNAEVFYSRVSDIEEMFSCLSHQLHYMIGGEQLFSIQMQRACEISSACTTLIHAALRYRDEHKNWYPSPEGLTPWNCQPVVRSGLWSIASFIMQLLKEAVAVDLSMKSKLWSELEEVSDVLLEAYTGIITAKIECGEEHKGLVEEYRIRRDELLSSLYELAKRFVDAKYQDSCKGIDDPGLKEVIFREVTLSILSIAKRHEGYQTLWHICYDLSDTGLLRSLMHDSVGPKGGFSSFVFKQLIKSCQYAKLLRLGEEFQDELAIFLKEHKDLLWLHEIFLNQFSSASETLHALALSISDGSSLLIDEELELAQLKRVPSLADRRRILNLSKIAAMAGKNVGFEMKVRRIEADLQILKLQEEILGRLTDTKEGLDTKKPLPPGELIEMCLRGGLELSLKAFEVFAWTSSSFRISNRSLLEECWKNAADQDDWAALCQASTTEGWSDEIVLESLRNTLLFKASNRCYGPGAETYDGGFEEVLPLQKEDMGFPNFKEASSSVEGLLMQHKDFPDAGKLMLTAILMGKEGNDAVVEEDVAMDSQ
ncbi:nuclear pore complex protein NUP133 isoform X3 [Elaeis guineensis]|uniref:Nuclear pore complex protein NUP133 isoform X3 n=1 Tax=Elaeis guineensis var. tenera TaxID=51953 RepID=A0A6I9QFV5_ELAGV|nr:nuclear pore complex protein NUP133 isoform X3 [Elaeis guineensis]